MPAFRRTDDEVSRDARRPTLIWCMTVAAGLFAIPYLACAADSVPVWQVWQRGFALREVPDRPALHLPEVAFVGPAGERIIIRAFWDGGARWIVRFAPTASGRWTYRGPCGLDTERDSAGEDCLNGTIEASRASTDNPLWRHGGFLKPSASGRYLTYTDGTPFFWLADTWWFCPSALCRTGDTSDAKPSRSLFRDSLARRVAQGFNVIQMAATGTGGIVDDPLAPAEWGEVKLSLWRDFDEMVASANRAGIVIGLAVGFHRRLDTIPAETLLEIWRYILARYGAHALAWLLVGEYNLDNNAQRIAKVDAVGRLIAMNDPYPRLTTVHPSGIRIDRRQLWNAPWLNTRMIQSGHRPELPPADTYFAAYASRTIKPWIEAEANYEGIHGQPAPLVRRAAYRALMFGAAGYSYGAHGLWYPTQSTNDTTFAEYGKAPPWWVALQQPGADEVGLMRELAVALPWWQMEPRPGAVFSGTRVATEHEPLLAAGQDGWLCIYFPRGLDPETPFVTRQRDENLSYSVEWFSPARGNSMHSASLVEPEGRFLPLPSRPNEDDWFLILSPVD